MVKCLGVEVGVRNFSFHLISSHLSSAKNNIAKPYIYVEPLNVQQVCTFKKLFFYLSSSAIQTPHYSLDWNSCAECQ